MKTLFFKHTGPMLRYGGGVLYIDDLNPEIATKWRMSRMEMLRVGLKFMAAAIIDKGRQ